MSRHDLLRLLVCATATALLAAGCSKQPVSPTIPSAPVTRGPYVVSGFAHLPAPDNTIAVGSVDVEVVDPADDRRAREVYVTDARGAFTLTPTSVADFDLIFSRGDFESTRYSLRGLAANRNIDVALMPQRTHAWSGTIDSRRADGIDSILEGWPGPYRFETHQAGDARLHLEIGCIAAGTYTDFTFAIEPDGSRTVLTLATAHGMIGPGGVLKYGFDSDPVSLAPGRYQIVGELTGYNRGLCPWQLSLTRPY